MALSIETREADELARSLARLTGESMTDAITAALRERLERERARRQAATDFAIRLTELSRRLSAAYDTSPVSRKEWDNAAGDQS